MKTCENMGSGHCSDAEPNVFIVILNCMFPTPCVFAVVLARFGLAVAQWVAAYAADLFEMNEKTWGFGNMGDIMLVKTQGSAPGTR